MPKKWLMYAVTVYTAAVTLLRTFRLPNDWAEAHWLTGYPLGVYKRGLIGSVVSALFPPSSPQAAELFISVASVVLTLCALATAVYICTRQPVAVGLAMVSSPLLVMWGHITGYFDFFLFLLTFGSLFAVKRQRYWVASLLLASGVLIHESILVVGFPVVGFAVLYQNLFLPARKTVRQTVADLLTVFALPAGTAAVLLFMVSRHNTHAGIMAFLHAYGFMHNSVGVIADAHNTTFSEYYEKQSPVFGHRMFHTLYISLYVSVAYFMVYLHTRLRKHKKVVWLMYPIVFVPLLLHLIAWDTARIWTYPLMEALLLFYVSDSLPKPRGYDRPAGLLFSGLIIIVHVFYAIPLMDDQTERFSDFEKFLLYLPPLAYLVYLILHKSKPADNALSD